MDPIDIFDPLAESSQLPYAVGSQLPYEVGTESKKRFDQLRTRLEKAKIAHRKDCEKQDEDAQVIYTLAGRKLAQAIGNALDNDVWTEAMQDVVDSKRSGRIEFPWIATAEWKFWKGGPQIWEAFARIEVPLRRLFAYSSACTGHSRIPVSRRNSQGACSRPSLSRGESDPVRGHGSR